MKKPLSLFLFIVILLECALLCSCSQKSFTYYSFDCFDTVTSISGYDKNKKSFDEQCEKIMSELTEYHKLFDIYNSYEGINNLYTINEQGKDSAIKVDRRIIDMLLFSKEMYEKTEGRLNVAMGSVLSVWHSYRTAGINNPELSELPPMDMLKLASLHTSIEDVIIDEENSTVMLADKEMSLDVGAIAKGYAIEMTALKFEKEGLDGYLLNVGGNVRAIGKPSDGKKWKVGIENPDGSEENPYYTVLSIENMSVVTSGSYQRYYIVDEHEYNHIIDKDTLMPAELYTSVSVITESSAAADALSTALFTMSYDDGVKLIEKFENIYAMWVLRDGSIKYSKSFDKLFIS